MPNNNPQQTTAQQHIAKAADGASKAAEVLEHGAETAASVAIDKVRKVRDEAQSGLEQQREQIADRIRRIGGVLRAGSQTLSTDDALSQQLFSTAGDRIEQVAEYIATVTPGGLADDVQVLARRRPGLFFGGSFILGLALGRFAKSSASALSSSGAGSSQLDEDYQATVTTQQISAPRKRSRQQPQSQAQSPAPSTQSSSRGQSAAGSQSASGGSQSATGTQSTGASSLPQGVGSSATATTGTGSAHSPAPNAGPSYGQSASTTSAKPELSSNTTKATSVEPGEGSKS